ncbi:2-oxoacid:acceptor oxidoreductase family protein [Thermogladius sp. KZ2Tp1]|uniref:2-oxoacid:acceptor oxidoreductase family protein n=1 Tax=Thermogladius sp. KZ2Tp1 TaxID=3136289 RepID=UPI003DA978D8
MLIEITWYGRGGQGAWTSSNILAMAAALDGKHAQSFPAFGPERSGAPMLAFTRISDEPIEIHSMVYNPDVVIVLDDSLISPKVYAGIKENGVLILNYEGDKESLFKRLGDLPQGVKVYTTPATRLALEILKANITNTAMIGGLMKAWSIVSWGSLEKAVKERFKGAVADKNIDLIRKSHDLTVKVK